jgi:hypothetical protein
MNLEKTSIVVETISFLLVAPEFLGSHRLSNIENTIAEWTVRKQNTLQMSHNRILTDWHTASRPAPVKHFHRVAEVLFTLTVATALLVIILQFRALPTAHDWPSWLRAIFSLASGARVKLLLALNLAILLPIANAWLRVPLLLATHAYARALLHSLLWAFVGVFCWNLIFDLQMVPDFRRRLLLWGLFWLHTLVICSIWIPAFGWRYVTQVLNWFGSRIVRSLADQHELRLWVFAVGATLYFTSKTLAWIHASR